MLAHDPPPATVDIGGRPFTLGTADLTQAALTAQAHALIERSRLGARLARLPVEPAPEAALLAVHTPEYLERLRAACAGGPWDGAYAPVTAGTWEAGTLTVGAVLGAVDAVLDGRLPRALVHARPAGHHAEPDRAIASTYLNNLACGAEHALARGAARVAIVDWDVHVGNGAERIFWDRRGGPRRVAAPARLVSRPRGRDRRDRRRARRRRHGQRAAARRHHGRRLPARLRRDRGARSCAASGPTSSCSPRARTPPSRTPPGRMLVSAGGFRALAERAAALADEVCGGRLVAATEGGYSPIYNPFCLLAVLEGLAGEDAGVADPWADDPTVRAARAPADDRARAAVAAVRAAQPRWFR